jgi:hypothetical protein
MDLLGKELQHGEFAQNQRMTSHSLSVSFRALDLCRQHAVRRNNTRHKSGVVAPHSADTETSSRQFPYHPVQAQIYFIFFSTSKRGMEMNETFAYMFQSLNDSLFSMVGTYIHNGLLTHRIELSSTKFEIYTIKTFSCCLVVELRSVVHRYSFCYLKVGAFLNNNLAKLSFEGFYYFHYRFVLFSNSVLYENNLTTNRTFDCL